jgi:hypothetical protein
MSDNLSHSQGLNASLSSGALAAGTNAGTIKTASVITYALDGRFYSKAATDNIAISYAGSAVYQASAGGVATLNGAFMGGVNGSTRLYLLCLDASGNVSIVPGKVVDSTELAGGRVSLDFPDCPNLVCPFGALRVALTSGAAFVPGTTSLAASGVTAAYINLATVPANPLTA